MSNTLNKVTLIGYLGKDPEIRYHQSGQKLAKLSLVAQDQWEDDDTGVKYSEIEWHQAVIFNESLAELADKYLQKGNRVYVEGHIRTRKWKTRGGVLMKAIEIIVGKVKGDLRLLDSKGFDPMTEEISEENAALGI